MAEKTNPQDRRRFKRTKISYYLPVLDPESLQTVGHLVDINQIGLLLDCSYPMIGGTEHQLRIDTPPGSSDKVCIVFRARVKWCRMDRIEPNTYNVGFEMTSISPGDAAIIQHIAEMYGSR